jgi:hypothetical protein
MASSVSPGARSRLAFAQTSAVGTGSGRMWLCPNSTAAAADNGTSRLVK